MSRRSALLVATLVVFAAGLVFLVVRFGMTGPGPAGDGAAGTAAEGAAQDGPPIPPTSEQLIAEALAAGDLVNLVNVELVIHGRNGRIPRSGVGTGAGAPSRFLARRA